MIGRILHAATALALWLCLATVAAQALTAAWLWSTGRLDMGRLELLAAMLGGAEPAAQRSTATAATSRTDSEQPSLDDVAAKRALRARDLELREQALANQLLVVRSEYSKLVDEKDRYERIKTAFKTQLDEIEQSTLATNKETARLIVENMKPKQAKEQILRMIEDKEMDEAVALLENMTVTKRSRIVGEFKTEEEAARLAEVLKLIREGVPRLPLVQDTKNQVREPASSVQ